MHCEPPTTPAVPRKNYVEPETLKKLTRGARSRSPVKREKSLAELVAVWVKIARGTNRRYGFVRGSASIDDYVQECLLDLVEHGLKNANPAGNLFSYYTRICQNRGRKIASARLQEAAAFEAYRAAVIATHVTDGLQADEAPAGPEHADASAAHRSEDEDDEG